MRGKAPFAEYLRRNPFPNPYTEGFFYREKMRAIHRVAPDVPLAEILEVGGGQSGLTSLLYPYAGITNVDLDEDVARSPVNLGPRIRFLRADATSLPFDDASFDAVTMFDVLEHVEDDRAAVAEALRVLRPRGFLLVTTPNERWRFPFYRLLRPICLSEDEMIEKWSHVRRGYALAELERLVGTRPSAHADFITPLTVICHDVAFSQLPAAVRRGLCAALAPVTLLGYALPAATVRGTETASSWQKPSA